MNRQRLEELIPDYVGGDVESQDEMETCRGPTAKIYIDGDLLRVTVTWAAVIRVSKTPWTFVPEEDTPSFGVNIGLLRLDSAGRLVADRPMMGPMIFFPRGDHNTLSPRDVQGMPTKFLT